MTNQFATKIIDGDGHIQEDSEGIVAHMSNPYRKIAERRNVVFPPLDHLHAGRAVETPPRAGRPARRFNWIDDLMCTILINRH